MKKILLTATVLVFLSTITQAQEKLSTSGYIDLSYSYSDTDDEKIDKKLALDLFHINLNYKLSDQLTVSGHVSGGSDEDFDLEQAHLIYTANDNLSFIAGKFLSIQGWEAFHAPDMFQNSYSATIVYPAMMNGAGATYTGDNFSVYGAALASAWDSEDTDMENSAYEGAIKISSIDNVIIHLGGVTEDFDAGYTQTLVNLWASYSLNNLILALEYNVLSDWNGQDNDGSGWLIMANYALNDKAAITLRTSALEIDDVNNASLTDETKWTISPSYAISDHLSVLFEYSVLTNDISDKDTNYFAIETTVTF